MERLVERMNAGEIHPAVMEQLRGVPSDGIARGTISLAEISDTCFFRSPNGKLDWDLVIVAAARVLENLPGVEPLIDSGEAAAAATRWIARCHS